MVLFSLVPRSRTVIAISGVVALAGCAELGPPGSLQVTLAVTGAHASPSDPAVITVTAVNNTTTRMSWGTGSSSCTLTAAVRVAGAWVPILGERVCTTDTTEHALDAGQTRTEAFGWHGHVRRNGQTELLAPGTYLIRGQAGTMGASRTVTITVAGAA
jgi:hypothetical protein